MRLLNAASALVFFPYLGPLNGLDLQPFFLIFFGIVLFRRASRMARKNLVILVFSALVVVSYS
jgi:hypothetical protein